MKIMHSMDILKMIYLFTNSGDKIMYAMKYHDSMRL